MNQPAQNQEVAVAESSPVIKLELVKTMARDAHLDPQAFAATVMRTCFDVAVTKEQFLAFLMVANEYGLNPLTKEIHGFAKGGKVVPIVGVDGWIRLINQHPQHDGMEYEDHRNENGVVEAITCIIYRKDRTHAMKVTEYLSECKMDTSTWKKWPTRMLRHKATIQCARLAYGFSNIYDPDEAERIKQGETDILGTATVVPEEPQGSAAERIVSKIGDKVADLDFAPSGANAEGSGEPIDDAAEAEIAAAGGQPEDDGPVNVDEIPGVKKGSEVKAPAKKKAAAGKKRPQDQSHEDYVAELEGGDDE